ncbi:GNAT superfamily N-acetyltransferase [Microbacterium keratanolyticum]|uniref:N-acetyltransferase n=1 Tax=Microbacterium keratanolyticum TaxID=67574 RepID=A0A9W6M9N6_9MICO|nr:GNAT family N-acetyltransferase [Microbacterium keratanolyticum]MBM7467507.1 GNAT superfamily N-acetyltransferase [Microbacterium keratanolyticum]GLK02496.1 N-acetyltransferase [Microbacterium keratanolyticum]
MLIDSAPLLRAAVPEDVHAVVALKREVLHADLDRLGIWDEDRSRERVEHYFAPERTRMIVLEDRVVGTVSVRPAPDGTWLEMFYLRADVQGRGIGTRVLQALLAETPGIWRLQVLCGSPARSLYERHGFVAVEDDGIDVWMVRTG